MSSSSIMNSVRAAGTRVRNRYRRMAADAFGRRSVPLQTRLPIVSFTFDDFPASALHIGGAILKQHGACGTYYAALGLMNKNSPVGTIFSEADLRQALASGQELGSHTFSHCHAWETAPVAFEESLVQNRHALEALVPGASFATLSYPISEPRPEIKRRAQKHFACCRGGGQTFNVGAVDLNNLRGFFLEQCRDNPARIFETIAQNARAGGWLIFATHDVCDQPSRFGCTPAFFEETVQHAVASGARILPVARAWEEICQDAPAGEPVLSRP